MVFLAQKTMSFLGHCLLPQRIKTLCTTCYIEYLSSNSEGEFRFCFGYTMGQQTGQTVIYFIVLAYIYF